LNILLIVVTNIHINIFESCENILLIVVTIHIHIRIFESCVCY
jgi:hypothetical protein